MADNSRIEDLRRRVLKDPASIAFAQLAEEHRRAGDLAEAVRVCRAGLAQHPAYLSARITLGRALLEMGRLDEATTEFEYVLKAAPDNLSALRELADLHQRRRKSSDSGASPGAATVVTPTAPATEVPTVADRAPALDQVIVELEAWLSVLADERVARSATV